MNTPASARTRKGNRAFPLLLVLALAALFVTANLPPHQSAVGFVFALAFAIAALTSWADDSLGAS